MTGKTTLLSYLGAAGSIISSLTLTEWGIVIGITTALGTFAFNVWARTTEVRMRKREDARQEQLMRDQIERRRHNMPVAYDRRACDTCPVITGAAAQTGEV